MSILWVHQLELEQLWFIYDENLIQITAFFFIFFVGAASPTRFYILSLLP